MRGTFTSRRSTSGTMTCSLAGCCGAPPGAGVVCADAVAASAPRTRENARARGDMVVVRSEEEGEADRARAVLGAARVGDEGGVVRVVDARDEAVGEVEL